MRNALRADRISTKELRDIAINTDDGELEYSMCVRLERIYAALNALERRILAPCFASLGQWVTLASTAARLLT
jgi:hypothetical protein